MLRIAISQGNDCFMGNSNKEKETARILRVLADRIERGDKQGKIMDINGNSVGFFATDRLLERRLKWDL